VVVLVVVVVGRVVVVVLVVVVVVGRVVVVVVPVQRNGAGAPSGIHISKHDIDSIAGDTTFCGREFPSIFGTDGTRNMVHQIRMCNAAQGVVTGAPFSPAAQVRIRVILYRDPHRISGDCVSLDFGLRVADD
jgi:hypothetical protein